MTDQAKKKKRPADTNKRAFDIVRESVGEAPEPEKSDKDPAAVALGRKGGLKGGKARAEKLSPEKRREIAKIAAQARWKKEKLDEKS